MPDKHPASSRTPAAASAAVATEPVEVRVSQLRVNGRAYYPAGDPEMPLLWYLRDVLRLTGTKFGCGVGACGACTVLIDGKAQRACLTPVKTAMDHDVTTIEGLAGAELHPLQRAWIEEDVAQCGYCQAGQIMSATALLAAKPKPTDADIDAAMSGNICRCATYPRIRAAIKRAAGSLA